MKITIVGAGGNIGKRITAEAAYRNHELHLITSKEVSEFQLENTDKVSTEKVDIFNTEQLASVFKNSDVVISSYAPPHDDTDILIDASKSLVTAAKEAGTRLIAVGGAGSLKVSDDLLLIDAPNFPEEYKAIAQSHLTVLETVYKPEKNLNWTNVSPSAYIFEGERTGNFRIGEDQLISNENGDSSISMEDFAVGVLNEVETPAYSKKRFTIGY
ncbi:NAD(P)H-binding protein [Aquimarina sp. D1M17]|uniref:NAD(P)-dependent oxidoreductase n=1 Tax=Aquimarina acroporae TaxID=2937283 RepID=UPI0020C09F54|nr:NAD(P)H-binding protein [Aquimarina acroporae]MCK8522412.1 NAD(P)H-binding protein [Aquimarina acroporae]